MKNQLTPIKLDDFGPIRETVFSTLRNAILDGKLRPGERLVERDIAEKLGISRTPIREAIRKLELERLVVHIPRKGVVVAGFTKEEVMEILAIRSVLEGLICRIAAEKIEDKEVERLEYLLEQINQEHLKGNVKKVNTLHDKFHDTIYRSADSPRLYDLISTLGEYIRKFAQIGYTKPGRTEKAIIEHREMLNSLRKRDPKEAERTAIKHVENSRDAYLETYMTHHFKEE
ncbi:GntR family transcriptional regulator [Paradesulfitobacterium ferrireducens]|uniref:GntR family transcriptional regulator n=1 Tax=Paradesulfitobacterium ferrireducens TaxID=2816476 RepID=UPI001A8E6194|nr:GntR family transcriptional regulator [Paradesulfitobacterium ferrireducens]